MSGVKPLAMAAFFVVVDPPADPCPGLFLFDFLPITKHTNERIIPMTHKAIKPTSKDLFQLHEPSITKITYLFTANKDGSF